MKVMTLKKSPNKDQVPYLSTSRRKGTLSQKDEHGSITHEKGESAAHERGEGMKEHPRFKKHPGMLKASKKDAGPYKK